MLHPLLLVSRGEQQSDVERVAPRAIDLGCSLALSRGECQHCGRGLRRTINILESWDFHSGALPLADQKGPRRFECRGARARRRSEAYRSPPVRFSAELATSGTSAATRAANAFVPNEPPRSWVRHCGLAMARSSASSMTAAA